MGLVLLPHSRALVANHDVLGGVHIVRLLLLVVVYVCPSEEIRFPFAVI